MSVLRILAYHAIAELPRAGADWRYGVPLAEFQAQIDQLRASGYTFVDGDRLLAFVTRRLHLPPRAVLVTFDDCHVSLGPASRWLASRGIRGVAFAASGALLPGQPVEGAVAPMLDREGLAALVGAGLEIGAHGHLHRLLPSLSAEARTEEIGGAVARLEAAGLGPVRLFAYPYGAYDRAACDAVRRAGTAAAMTVDTGVVRPGDDPFRLRRIEIFRGETGRAFRLKVATGGGVARLRSALRVRSRLRRLRQGSLR